MQDPVGSWPVLYHVADRLLSGRLLERKWLNRFRARHTWKGQRNRWELPWTAELARRDPPDTELPFVGNSQDHCAVKVHSSFVLLVRRVLFLCWLHMKIELL